MTANLTIGIVQTPQNQIRLIEEGLARYCHPDAKPKASSVSLAILSPEGNTIISTHPVPPKLAREDLETFAREMAHTMFGEASGDISTQVQSTRYAIVSYSGEKVLGRSAILLHPPATNLLNAETESPTQTGVTAMAMRFTDLGLRMGMGAVNQANSDLREENQNLRAYINQLEGRRMEMFDKIEAARTAQFERDLEIKREQKQDERVEKVWAQVERLVPALCAKYGLPIGMKGVQQVPASEAAQSPVKAFLSLYSTLSDSQREQIVEVLTEDQKQVFFEAMKGFYAQASSEKASSD